MLNYFFKNPTYIFIATIYLSIVGGIIFNLEDFFGQPLLVVVLMLAVLIAASVFIVKQFLFNYRNDKNSI